MSNNGKTRSNVNENNAVSINIVENQSSHPQSIADPTKRYNRKPQRIECKKNDRTFMMAIDNQKGWTNCCLCFCWLIPIIFIPLGIYHFIVYGIDAYLSLFGTLFGGIMCLMACLWTIKFWKDGGYKWLIFNEEDDTVSYLIEYWYKNGYRRKMLGKLSNLKYWSTKSTTVEVNVDVNVDGISVPTTSKNTQCHFELSFLIKDNEYSFDDHEVFVSTKPVLDAMIKDFVPWFQENYANHELKKLGS